METLASPPAVEDLDLLRYDRAPHGPAQWRNAAIGSLVLHFFLIAYLASVPRNDSTPVPVSQPERKFLVAHLTDPPTELTQKAPNRQKLSKELVAEAIAPHPTVKTPAPAPAVKRTAPAPPAPAPNPVATAPKPVVPQIQPVEPPKIETAVKETPKLPSAVTREVTAPPPPPVEKPKLAFETPTPSTAPSNKAPNPAFVSANPVQEAMRNLARGGASGGQRVGDAVVDLSSPGPGLNLPPSAGRPRSDLELKSDPMGVDFKPYLIRVLATVRRNWYAIYPEAARLGQRGQVAVEFVVTNNGSIPKVAYSAQSGSRPLDEAAVAALSASNPLPPLPAEYKGTRVVLQFTFSYNMPTR